MSSGIHVFNDIHLKKFGKPDFGGYALLCVKLLAITLLLAKAPWAWGDLFTPVFAKFLTERPFYAVGYALVFWTALISSGVIPFLANAYIRILLITLIVVGYGADQMFWDITGVHFDLSMVKLVWLERRSGFDGLSWYVMYFIRDCLWVFGVGIILALPPTRWALRPRWSAIPLCAFAIVSIIIPYTKGGTQYFPTPFSLPIMFAMAASTNLQINTVAEVKYDGPINPIAKHIVFIVDESVRGDVLEINEPLAHNTPFLVSRKDELINFGVAVSGANCSFLSRTMLRFGIQSDDFQESDLSPGLTSLKRPIGPPIWKYARQAGYRTIMINGREEETTYIAAELPMIEYFPEFGDPPYTRDGLIAERLLQLLKQDVPSFVYVNKFGAHFPHEADFPPDYDKSRVSPEGEYSVGADSRVQLLHAYNNALRWSVDGFFQKFFSRLDKQNVLIVYTSDHGQSLMEGGQRISHCSTKNTQVGEGLVPLIVSTGIPDLAVRFREGATHIYGQATHFEIFPTLLLAMGYDEQWVRERYGPSLLDIPVNRHRRFIFTTSYDLFGDFRWLQVD
jgi:glucan phosphoethanolaminetransferase (alkaline phosphatase superfamily)